MTNLFDTEDNGATFSPCRKYRYELHRIWDKKLPLIMFIGLNPSTADETQPDRTISRVKGFAYDWGYGGFYMLNLFAVVSEDPKVLKTHPDPLGDNDGWIEKIAPLCKQVIFAWGNFKEARERAQKIIPMFPNAQALVLNKNGSPRHPLYVDGCTQPVPYKS